MKSYMINIRKDLVEKHLSKGLNEEEAIIEVLSTFKKPMIFDSIEYKKFMFTYHVYLIRKVRR